jgi:hypothetical protein
LSPPDPGLRDDVAVLFVEDARSLVPTTYAVGPAAPTGNGTSELKGDDSDCRSSRTGVLSSPTLALTKLARDVTLRD